MTRLDDLKRINPSLTYDAIGASLINPYVREYIRRILEVDPFFYYRGDPNVVVDELAKTNCERLLISMDGGIDY